MEEQNDFTEQLNKKLSSYAQDLEKATLSGLKGDFYNFTASLVTIINILKKKGLMADDPYQYESKTSEVTPISTDSFLDGERTTVMSIRIQSFHHQLTFLGDFYQFSLDFMTLARIKAINGFIKFIRWDALTENSNEINTRALAEIIGRVRKGDDTISSGLINDAVNQLSSYQAKITEKLKRITLYKREDYKYTLRITFMNNLKFAPGEVDRDMEAAVRKVKKEFASHIKGQPFIPELVMEILNEDYTNAGAKLRDDLLKRLTVAEAVREKPKNERNFRAELMEAVRVLSGVNISMDAALRKLRESSAVMEDHVMSLGERLGAWFKTLMGVKKPKLLYEVELFDTGTSTSRKEVIEFEKFSEDLYSRIRIWASMTNKQSTNFQVLSMKDEDAIFEWYDRNFIDIAKFNERMNALDAYFKSEVTKEKRPLIKGIKTEISAVKSVLAAASKLKHEYVAAREEVEQLKRLGIKVD